MVAADTRQRIDRVLDQFSQERLEVILRFMELMLVAPDEGEDVEPEEMWLLATGKLETLIADLDNENNEEVPLDDIKGYLDEL